MNEYEALQYVDLVIETLHEWGIITEVTYGKISENQRHKLAEIVSEKSEEKMSMDARISTLNFAEKLKRENQQYAAKAQIMWESFTDDEKKLVRFGMFPHDKMQKVEADGLWDSHKLVCSLMDCAKRDGGMIA